MAAVEFDWPTPRSCSLGTVMVTRMPVLAKAKSRARSALYRRTWRICWDLRRATTWVGCGMSERSVPIFTPMNGSARENN